MDQITLIRFGLPSLHLPRLNCLLHNHYVLFSDKLVAGWEQEKVMQIDSSGRDLILLGDITGLQERTDKREQRIAEITGKLHDELVLLAKFLNNVAQRRPQGMYMLS